MNGQMGHLQKTMRSRTNLIFAVLLLVAGAVISAVAWPAVLQAQNTSSLNLSSLSVTDQNGTTVSIGTFDPATTTYSGSVASTVERVTVDVTSNSGSYAETYVMPMDSQPETPGHQVDLIHGTNLILVSLHSFSIDENLKTYSVEITRVGTGTSGAANTISLGGGTWAREGSTLPFLVTRTGDTAESLTVQIAIAERHGNLVLSSAEGSFNVEFDAGSASARHDVATYDVFAGTGTSAVQAEVVSGTGYTVNSDANKTTWHVWEDTPWNLNLEELDVFDPDDAEVDIGTFHHATKFYSGNVASTVESVTVNANTPSDHRDPFVILPADSQPGTPGHQVDLSHGNNLIIVAGTRNNLYRNMLNSYSVAINRAGSAPDGESTTVKVDSVETAEEGLPINFLLSRTGDTSQALTVQVEVTETGGNMVPASLRGQREVEFQAGQASARLDVPTERDEDWEEHSTLRVEVKEGSGYLVSTTSGSASILVQDNDVPAMTAVLTVDSAEAEEGEEVTATITVTTEVPKKPHRYAGTLKIQTTAGTADRYDFETTETTEVNGESFGLATLNFRPIEAGGVTTAYQIEFSTVIAITDDERAEGDETFTIEMVDLFPEDSPDALVLDQESILHTITIPGAEETPSPPVANSYATVAVADSGSTGSTFTISWYDPEGCDGEYSASIWDARSNWLIVTIQTLGPDGWSTGDGGRSGLPLGSTASGNTQMVQTLDYIDLDGDQFAVEVYCRAEGRMFAEVPLPSLAAETVERPKPGTYSSEAALTGLTISSGTLSPAFNKDGFLYAVLDVPNDDEQVTFNATAKSGYSISWDPATDADSSADGQQVDLAVGYNTIFVNVVHDEGVNSFVYEVIVKRAEPAAKTNTQATGIPNISGTARVGETLTADTSGIADADGLARATFVYQWLADDVEITGAASSTYVLTSNEMDKAIKVRVSFTDDSGNNKVLSSAATGAVSPAIQQQQSNTSAVGAPTIVGTVQVGETLTADTSGISDTEGITSVSYTYQWIRSDGTSDYDITGATDSTYTLVDADEGKTVKVKVSFTDDAGSNESLASAATATVSARPILGSAPDTPDQPNGTAVFVGGVDLEWNDVPGADSYDVQLFRKFRNGQLWTDLPGDGVEIAFYGAGAIISELDPGSSHWFQVRAGNAHGSSDWSDFRQVGSTNQTTSGKRARPDNVTGQWRAGHHWHGAGRREPHSRYDGHRGRERSGPGAVPVPMGDQRWERRR